MKLKTRVLKQIGYRITGEALLNLWGGGQGYIKMNRTDIPFNKFNKTNLLKSINDGGFGCESIEEAEILIYDLYENNYTELSRHLVIKGTKERNKLFCLGV